MWKKIAENTKTCPNCGNMIEDNDLTQNQENKELGLFSIWGIVLVSIPAIISLIFMIAGFGYPIFPSSLFFIIPSVVGCAFAGCSLVIYKNTNYKIIAVITLVLFVFFNFYII